MQRSTPADSLVVRQHFLTYFGEAAQVSEERIKRRLARPDCYAAHDESRYCELHFYGREKGVEVYAWLGENRRVLTSLLALVLRDLTAEHPEARAWQLWGTLDPAVAETWSDFFVLGGRHIVRLWPLDTGQTGGSALIADLLAFAQAHGL